MVTEVNEFVDRRVDASVSVRPATECVPRATITTNDNGAGECTVKRASRPASMAVSIVESRKVREAQCYGD